MKTIKEKIFIIIGLLLIAASCVFMFRPNISYAVNLVKPEIEYFGIAEDEENALRLKVKFDNKRDYSIEVSNVTLNQTNIIKANELIYQNLEKGKTYSVKARACTNTGEYLCSEWTDLKDATVKDIVTTQCSSGQILSGNTCVKAEVVAANAQENKSCINGDCDDSKCSGTDVWDGQRCITPVEGCLLGEKYDEASKKCIKKIPQCSATEVYNSEIDKCVEVKDNEIGLIDVNPEYYTFDSSSGDRTPSVIANNKDGKALVQDKDYTVSLPQERSAIGKYSILVAGKGGYTGTASASFEIRPSSTSIKSVTSSNNNIKVSIEEAKESNVSYQVAYKKIASAGIFNTRTSDTPEITVDGLDSGTLYQVKVRTFSNVNGVAVYSTDWSDVKNVKTTGFSKIINATLSETSYTYTGVYKKPLVTVKDATNSKLTEGVDFRVTYSEGQYGAKEVGMHRVTVIGKGKYYGTKILTFSINPGNSKVNDVYLATEKGKDLVVNVKKPSKDPGSLEYQISYKKTTSPDSEYAANTTQLMSSRNIEIGTLEDNVSYDFRVKACKQVGNTYHCSGWSAIKTRVIDSSITVNPNPEADEDLVPKQEPLKLNFNSNYGTLNGDSKLYVKNGEKDLYKDENLTTKASIPTASKDGYTFNGWYNQAVQGIRVIDASGNVTSDAVNGFTSDNGFALDESRTLYAQYTKNSSGNSGLDNNNNSKSSSNTKSANNTNQTKSDTYTGAINRISVALTGYNNINVSWSKVNDASGYQLCYKKSTDKKYTCNNNGSTVGIRFADGIKYDFKVAPYKKLNGKIVVSSSSKSLSIYTLKKMDKPKVKKASSKKVKVTVKKVDGATGYEVATSSKKNSGYKVVKTSSFNKTSVNISATKGKKTYYKVRAYKNENGKKINAPYSKVKKYKLK